MKNKVYNGKTNKAAKKDVKNLINQDDSNSNTTYTYFKFVSFTSTIDQVIQNNLQLY